MNIFKTIRTLQRCAGLTMCENGYHDLAPVTLRADARVWERFEDFSAQSMHRPPPQGVPGPAWCPAYIQEDANGYKRLFADFIVFDLHGASADAVQEWLAFGCNLVGMVHPTKSDSFLKPRCRVIILLNRPVNMTTYRHLWNRISSDAFAGIPNASHADGRQRYDMPHSLTGASLVLFSGDNPLSVDGALSSPSCDEHSLARVSEIYADDIWPESLPPVDR